MITYSKQYKTGEAKATQTVEEIRQSMIDRVLVLPPIMARGVCDELITVNMKTDPITVEWNREVLQGKVLDQMWNIVNVLENRFERQHI